MTRGETWGRPVVGCILGIAAVLLVFSTTAPCVARGSRSKGKAKEPPAPRVLVWPKARALTAGPLVLGTGLGKQLIRWETVGKTRGRVVLKDPEGDQRKLRGHLMPAEPATVEFPTRAYEVLLPDLKPCSTYRFRLEPWNRKGFPYRFRTPPRPGELCPGKNRFVVYGDSRKEFETHRSLMPGLKKSQPHLAVNVGDLVYRAKDVDEWPVHFDIERGFLGNTLFAMVPGNHDATGSRPVGGAMLRRYFAVDGEGGTGHWSFDWGLVHFIMLDLYWGEALDAGGLEWLRKAVRRVPADRYVVVVLHEPLYSFGHHKPKEVLVGLRQFFAGEGQRVQAVFAGHAHVYERFVVEGIHFLSLGGHGASLHRARANVDPLFEGNLVATHSKYHYLRVDVSEEFLTLVAVETLTSKVLDRWKIPRPGISGETGASSSAGEDD